MNGRGKDLTTMEALLERFWALTDKGSSMVTRERGGVIVTWCLLSGTNGRVRGRSVEVVLRRAIEAIEAAAPAEADAEDERALGTKVLVVARKFSGRPNDDTTQKEIRMAVREVIVQHVAAGGRTRHVKIMMAGNALEIRHPDDPQDVTDL